VAEGAVLVGVTLPGAPPGEAEASLAELERLAGSAGAQVLGSLLQARRGIDPATYIGSGKVQLLKDKVEALGADLVVFDDELKPSQQRNLEEALGGPKVLDRTQLILDVFAGRASTNEGRLQVELAQLSYLLPRLTGMGKALSRLGGGVGTRGPGETKLESDRRRLRDRIALLAGEIEEVSRTRSLQRALRRRRRAQVVALAGYTNAGKSSLFNALTLGQAYVEDRLFATLDPTVRTLEMGAAGAPPLPLLLVDTVGFVRKLPHALVAAFRATLEEVAEADVILKVVDAADPQWPQHLASVDEVLAQVYALHLHGRPEPQPWLVFNKCDRLGPAELKALKAAHPRAHFTSAIQRSGLDGLKQALRDALEKGLAKRQYLIPHAALGQWDRHLQDLRVLKREWTADGLKVEAVVSHELAGLEPYRVKAPAKAKAKGAKR
jgi:GTP-binding protein HflX